MLLHFCLFEFLGKKIANKEAVLEHYLYTSRPSRKIKFETLGLSA